MKPSKQIKELCKLFNTQKWIFFVFVKCKLNSFSLIIVFKEKKLTKYLQVLIPHITIPNIFNF